MRTDPITYEAFGSNITGNCLLPSAALCKSLVALFKGGYPLVNQANPTRIPILGTIPKLFKIFQNNIYDFKRVDFNTTQLPALCIYPASGSLLGESWRMNSFINMDFTYPGGAMVRERSTEIAGVMSEAVIFTLLKNDNILELLKFGLPDANGNPTWGPFPALVELGERISSDFTEVNALVKKQDSVTMRLRVSYTIDTEQWWNYIQEVLGNNIYDPSQYLYDYIAAYEADVILESALTPVPSYPTD